MGSANGGGDTSKTNDADENAVNSNDGKSDSVFSNLEAGNPVNDATEKDDSNSVSGSAVSFSLFSRARAHTSLENTSTTVKTYFILPPLLNGKAFASVEASLR